MLRESRHCSKPVSATTKLGSSCRSSVTLTSLRCKNSPYSLDAYSLDAHFLNERLGPNMFFSRPWFRSIFIVPAFMTTLVLVSASNVLGQTPDGALAGTIHDASGAQVVGAQVSATATASGLSKNTISDASGEFRLEALQPGEYQLEVTAPRFAPARSAITITVGSVSSVAI